MQIEFDDDANEASMTMVIAERNWLRMKRKYKAVCEEMERNRKQKEVGK